MTTADIAATRNGLSTDEHRRQLRRALIASTVGTTIEWYDFLLYGQVTGLVFGKLFFPQSDPIVGVLQAFAVFFIGFVGRPIGAAIFGHWGDRIGRKATLIATLLVTGFATVAVGLVPTYESIGIWGAVLLTIIRLIQGIGVGGEWGGSVLLAMEWARTTKNRGFLAAWPQFGGPAGLFLANLAVLFFSWLSGDQFLVWGWRIPFLISIVMVGIGLWIRLGISETPVFQKVLDEERVERVPVLEVLKRQPKQVALTVRPHRAQAHVYNRLNLFRDLRLHLLRPARYESAGSDLYRHRAVVASRHDVLWPTGGNDRRKLYSAAALQRHLAGLSARFDNRWRSVAVHRDGTVRYVRVELSDCPLYSRLRGARHHRGSVAHGLHQQGHLCRIRAGLNCSDGFRQALAAIAQRLGIGH